MTDLFSGGQASQSLLSHHLHLILQVVDGQSIIHAIEHVKRNIYDERPLEDIVITKSGELPEIKPYLVADHPYT